MLNMSEIKYTLLFKNMALLILQAKYAQQTVEMILLKVP